MPSQEIEHLRMLTQVLPIFPDTYCSHPGFKRYVVEHGNSMVWNLDSDSGDKAGVVKGFNSNGSSFPIHSHEGREWLVVKEGSLVLTEHGKEPVRIKAGEGIVIEPGVLHAVNFDEDCWSYAITIPREKNWPE